MKKSIRLVFLIVTILVILLGGCTPAPTIPPTPTPIPPTPTAIPSTPTRMYPTPLPKSFVCGDGTFKWFGLTNTKKRTKTLKDSLHPDESTCRLVDAGEGVIWMGIGVGHALFNAADMITVTNDKGEQLQPICWVDAGVMMGNTITRMFFAGPEDSNSFIVCCGDSCAQASGD